MNQSRPDPESSILSVQVLSPEGRGRNNANGFSKMLTHLGRDLDDRCPSAKFLFFIKGQHWDSYVSYKALLQL